MSRFTAQPSLLSCALLLSLSGAAHSAGFQIAEYSASAMGRALAGQGAIAEDASVQASNAAGLAFLDGQQMSASASYIDATIDVNGVYRGPFGPAGRPANGQNVAPSATVPAVYLSMPINEQLTFGMAANSHFGLMTDYGQSFGALALADESELKTANLNLNLALRTADWFAVGVGINVVKADAKLSSAIPEPTAFGPVNIGGRSLATLEGDDVGYGWNIGFLAQGTQGTRFGMSYRSAVDLDLQGSLSSQLYTGTRSALNPNGLNYNTAGTVALELPGIWEFALHQQVSDAWSLQASAFRINWSSFEELAPQTGNGQPFPTTTEAWENSWRLALGTTYIVSPELTLRAGVQKDESPVAAEHRTLRIPDTDRNWYTVGASWQVTQDVGLDLAYARLEGDTAHLNETTSAGNFQGKSNAVADIYTVQANYRF